MKLRTAISVALLWLCIGCSNRSREQRSSEALPPGGQATGSVVRLDPALDQIVPKAATIEKISSGHQFTEGPIYSREGYLLFSDIPRNAIYKWTPNGESEFRKQSGYSGDAANGALVGSNGLTLDKDGRLVICEHGNRRVTKLDVNGDTVVLADKYEGKRLNSPNDAVYKSDGALYFTDPPYGLAKQDDDPKKELKFNGVYRLANGNLQLLTKEMTRPNGIAFSPDEKYLYVANSDEAKKVWMKYEVKPDGTIANGQVFFDVTAEKEPGLPDGLKVDKAGNLYCTGPGGVWIFSAAGKHLGTIKPPETPANVHWGKLADVSRSASLGVNEDANTLYITAQTSVYRIALTTAGVRP